MTDKPIATTADGRPLYDNTPTVVCVIVPVANGVLAVRRAQNPGKGKLGLPGGYHMRGETWEECGCREVREETGFVLRAEELELQSIATDEYGNNLIIAEYTGDEQHEGYPIVPTTGDEVLELVLIHGDEGGWAFPRHAEAVWRWMQE